MRSIRAAGLVLLGLAFTGCSDDPLGFACTTQFVYGLSITVLDSTGAPAMDGATGVAIDGTHVDSLRVLGDRMVAAGERPGTYDITVSKTGFMTWSAGNITVTADECHVIPVSLQATLIPVP